MPKPLTVWTYTVHKLETNNKLENKLENSSRNGNTRPLYLPPEKSAGQAATVRTEHGATDWFQIGKGVHQGCIFSHCLFNLYAKYIMRNAGLDEEEAGINIAGRNINNLRYTDDTTLMAKSKEELEPLDETERG